MSTVSLLYLTVILPNGFATFYLMTKMKISHVFKGQENRSTAFIIGWPFFDVKLPLGMNPNPVLLLGAALQGFNSVAVIGCEIRTYMRLGLRYMTAVMASLGFLLGYLPYTLYQDFWEDLAIKHFDQPENQGPSIPLPHQLKELTFMLAR